MSLSANVLVIVAGGYFLLRPGGWVAEAVRTHYAERRLEDRIAAEWDRLTNAGGRLGAIPGRVVMVEFADYQCPFCRRAHVILTELLSRHPDVDVVYRHLPLAVHPAAEGAARASICAEEQGRFREMHEHLFDADGWMEDANWSYEAAAAGISDTAGFGACLVSARATERLKEDSALVTEFGIGATPTWVHHGGIERGVLSLAELEEMLGLQE